MPRTTLNSCNCSICRPGSVEPPAIEGDMPTYGFELEFARNVPALARELYLQGVCGGDTVHGWHCDCPTCEDDDFDFKVQHDSTVDGEVISRVFSDWPSGLAAMRELQEAAVKTDAEPGLNAGLHVHVARPDSLTDRVRALLAFIVWEDAITTLAQGRFPHIRNMNSRVRDGILNFLVARGDIDHSGSTSYRDQLVTYLDDLVTEARDNEHPSSAQRLFEYHLDADRHSNLNINTRFGTWEFRIWNATRSAWRMELAARLAVAWYDPEFINALLDFDGERTPEALRDVVAIEWQEDDRLAALIDRQVDYLPHAADAPREFLVA